MQKALLKIGVFQIHDEKLILNYYYYLDLVHKGSKFDCLAF